MSNKRFILADPFWRRSLKTRVTLFTLAIFLAGLWSLAYYASRMLREDMQHLLSDQQSSMVSYMAMAVNDQLAVRVRALEEVAKQLNPTLLRNPAALQALLEQHPILHLLFNAGVIGANRDGTALADVPLSSGRLGVNYMDRDHIAGALREGKAMIGRPIMGKKARAPIFGMAVPIRDAQGKVIGALAGVTNLEKPNFLDGITRHNDGEIGNYLLVAPQHRLIITASDKSRVMERLPAPGISPWIDRVVQGYEGTGIFINPMNVEVLTSVKGIPVAGWIMVVALPTAEAFAPIHIMQKHMLLATIFLTLLAGGLTWWMLRRQLAPILSAASTLATLSDDNLPPRPLPIVGQDEIGQLIGGFNRLLGTLRQREEALRESEGRFRRMFEHNDSVMLLIEPESGEIVDANAAAAHFYGYPVEHLKTLRIDQINTLPPDELAKRRALAVQHESNFFIFPHRLANGEERTVEVRSSPIEVGGRVLLFSIVHDVTERETAIAELKRSNAELEQFSYAVSHDMRQPLRMIASYLQLLGKELAAQLDGEKLEFFNFAIDGAKRLDRMLVALLEYSRVGRIGEPAAWVESRALLDDALLILQSEIDEAQASLSITGDWPSVFVSRDEILRLLQNLIGNALKFRVAGRTPKIAIACETTNRTWRISVSDNGVGIIPDQIGRLFQVFQRLQSRAAFDGTGIGLALCRKIAEHHGGRIWAESTGEGQGSTFRVELPVTLQVDEPTSHE